MNNQYNTHLKDFLRIYVLWHPQSVKGAMQADSISRHFDSLGMDRDGVQYRVPVRYRSEPWGAGNQPNAPRPIDLTEAEHNAIVYLHDSCSVADSAVWNPYIESMQAGIVARSNLDVFIPFTSGNTGLLPCLATGNIHHARQDKWAATLPDEKARLKRLLLHVLFCIRTKFRELDGSTGSEPLFVSHAKADGDPTAKAIVDHVNDSNHDVPLSTFYDAMELVPGQNFQKRFEDEIKNGTLLAIISDIYDSRPWCVYELTEAKRARRPILLADVGRIRTGRTYPYGANLPRTKLNGVDAASIEAVLVEALSEGLRCDLFSREASAILAAKKIANGYTLPRPPELLDIVDRDDLGAIVVYPDPPLGTIEQEIIDKALSMRKTPSITRALGELR